MKWEKPAAHAFWVLLGAAALCIALAAPADATFPGKNGKIAVAVTFPPRPPNFEFQLEIYTMNADGSGRTNLTNDAAIDLDPAWSPNGSKLAFDSNRDGDYEIYTMNADGSGLAKLTDNSTYDTQPSWSPDRSKIVFSSTRSGRWDIYTMNPDGSDQASLTSADPSDAQHRDPKWSPDGSKILYTCCSNYNDIWVMNSDGSGRTQLTHQGYPNDLDSPDWSPDGTRIAYDFGTDIDGEGTFEFQQHVMNADGTNDVIRVYLSDFPTGSAWSPDGTKIAIAIEGGINIFPVGSGSPTFISPPCCSSFDDFPSWQPLPGPQRSDFKNAAQFCKADQAFLGESAFGQKYGSNRNGSNGYGKCVSASGG